MAKTWITRLAVFCSAVALLATVGCGAAVDDAGNVVAPESVEAAFDYAAAGKADDSAEGDYEPYLCELFGQPETCKICGYLKEFQPPWYTKALDKEICSEANMLFVQLGCGQVAIKLFPHLAPGHVARVQTLARQGFYNGIWLEHGFEGVGLRTGGQEADLPALPRHINAMPLVRGVVVMAPGSSTHFGILRGDVRDGTYTAIGEVTTGMDCVDSLYTPEDEPTHWPAQAPRIVSVVADDDD